MVATKQSAPPIAPKRGWLLVVLVKPSDSVLASGLVIPSQVRDHIKRAKVVALGAEPVNFRTGEATPWDYRVGDMLVLNEMVQSAALPYEWDGGKLALVNEMHIAGLWVGGEDEV